MNSNKPLKLNSRFILPISLFYLTAMLAADVVAYKFVGIDNIVISGATIIFPFTYLFGDVIAEVYGYNIAKKIIWLGLICEFIFALTIKGIIDLPYASFANYGNDFNLILGSMLRFTVGGIIGNIVSSFLNIYLISKWKILVNGRAFWLRSIVSTALSELVIIGFAVMIGFTSRMSIEMAFKMIAWAYILEIFYAFIFVWPAWWLSLYLKKAENIDSYDYGVNYNPFHFAKD
ncbi:MAG: queuosine precursor transporter [Gammaproteobacteria bacterium]|nr:queuosine precursor transporter [Gammaproteobacteria bacterium]